MNEQGSEPSWFDVIFDEFHTRGEAMFAFSREQVEEQGVAWEDLQREWVSLDAGLLVKKSARVEFAHRMHTGLQAWEASLPELEVTYVGTDDWDRPVYRDGRGRRLVDVEYHAPNEAAELHTVTREGEPIEAIHVRPVFVSEEATP